MLVRPVEASSWRMGGIRGVESRPTSMSMTAGVTFLNIWNLRISTCQLLLKRHPYIKIYSCITSKSPSISDFVSPQMFQTCCRLLMDGYHRCCEMGFEVEGCRSGRYEILLTIFDKRFFCSIFVRMGSDEAARCCQVIHLSRICRPSTQTSGHMLKLSGR
jgi:hypothetical protein